MYAGQQSDDVMQTLRDLVFRDLWEKGFYLTTGLKYGGDFLVYSYLPSETHSSHIAIVLPWKQPSNTSVSLARVANKVKKNVLLCSVDAGGQISYHTLQWAGST
jgi:tRNA-splicing endonuclease subunit Sen34